MYRSTNILHTALNRNRIGQAYRNSNIENLKGKRLKKLTCTMKGPLIYCVIHIWHLLTQDLHIVLGL